MPPLTMTLCRGTSTYTATSSWTFAGSARGTILEAGGVDVVLSPQQRLSTTGAGRMCAIWSSSSMPATHQMVRIAEIEPLGVDVPWILAQQEKRAEGQLYRARCSSHTAVCIVTAESAWDILQGSRALLIEYAGMGGVAGFSLGLALGLFYLRSIGLAQQLRRALRRDGLQLVYQPILELPSRNCAGAEALARWSDEDGNPVSPEIFVRIAEERGFVGDLTSFVLRRAVHDVGDILRSHPELTLSINIAAADTGWRPPLRTLLDKHVRQARHRATSDCSFELTRNSSTAHLAVLREAILRLHHEGYQVHIDDFGTGFSSLAYLHELAVDAIKIDRTFTRTIGTDAVTAKRSILPQILALAESMQVEVIVEGRRDRGAGRIPDRHGQGDAGSGLVLWQAGGGQGLTQVS